MSGQAPDPMVTSAELSTDQTYRYQLGRFWSGLGAVATFIMLNPSTADAHVDDPTIRRCIGFAKSWGCGGLRVVNLYALRSTDPRNLWTHPDPVGPDNDICLGATAMQTSGSGAPLVAAWGAHAKADRVKQVLEILQGQRLQCLGVTKSGAPRHPLYIASATALTDYPGATS